jgi:5-methylcytosine-specific restriction endonuclease McrA
MTRMLTEAQKRAQAAYMKAYRAQHLEQLRAKDRQRRLEHGDEIRLREKISRDKRREPRRLKSQQYWTENAGALNAQRRAKRQEDLEAARALDRLAYMQKDKAKKRATERRRYARNKPQEAARKHIAYLNNPEIFTERSRERRARKAGAPSNDLTAAQWREIKAAFQQRCAYCGKKPRKLEQEHITPLFKGGSHTAANVVPSCVTCNRRKGTGEPLTPVQPLLLTLASARKEKAS